MGSGLGYLSRTLAFQYNWSVVAVEGRENNVAASNRIDATVQKGMQKRLDEIRETTYAPDRGALDPAACVANEKAGGYWAPWLK